MAVEVTLAAEPRTRMGKAECRRMRREGLIPANVYGHNEPPAAIVVTRDALKPVLQANARILDLHIGSHEQTVMLREIQWDPFGREIHHLDMIRIDKNERLRLNVPLELRGQAPGTLAGGHLEQQIRAVEIECTVVEIPDSIKVRIHTLEVGQAIYVRDLEIPANVKVLTNPDLMVVHVVQTAAPLEAEAGVAGAVAEPELIRKPEKEKAEDE